MLYLLPFKPGNNGGVNCELSDARCGGRKRGGVALGVLPLSKTGRKPVPLLFGKILKGKC